VADSQCRIVFAEDTGQLAKLTERRAELPNLTKVVLFDGTGDSDWVITLADLAESGEKYLLEHPSGVRTRTDAITPEQLATLIYTSGTTGRPKGVRLPHSVWAYEGSAVAGLKILGEDDLQLLWLPMAHAFGKVLVTTQLACGFVTAIDGRVDKIVDNLAVIKPTFMGAAPRIFEKAHARIVTTQQAKGGFRARLFAAAFSAGLEVNRRRRAGRAASLPMSLLNGLFDRLVFSKVREAFGGRIRFFICRRGTVEPRHRRVVSRRGPVDPGRLRPDRDRGRGVHQPARSLQAGHRRACPSTVRRYASTATEGRFRSAAAL
jgi:Long-chain acyl-CoA synthetases (AMP-forming)